MRLLKRLAAGICLSFDKKQRFAEKLRSFQACRAASA